MRDFVFDSKAAQVELGELKSYLESSDELGETEFVKFLRARHHVTGLIGTLHPRVACPDKQQWEYWIQSRFRTDLIVGSSKQSAFCLVEFEDARKNSVFHDTGRKLREWSPRFEHGFSQIVDWFHWLSTLTRDSPDLDDFGGAPPDLYGVLVAGRPSFHSSGESRRLEWRSMWVPVWGRPVLCFTLDDLVNFLSNRIDGYKRLC